VWISRPNRTRYTQQSEVQVPGKLNFRRLLRLPICRNPLSVLSRHRELRILLWHELPHQFRGIDLPIVRQDTSFTQNHLCAMVQFDGNRC
jgi:hypothetical protein